MDWTIDGRSELEGVEQRHRAVELGLRSGIAGRLEVDGAQRFAGRMLVLLSQGRDAEQECEQPNANAETDRLHNCLR